MTPNKPPLRIDWLTLRFTRRVVDFTAPTEVVSDDGEVLRNEDGDKAPSAEALKKAVVQMPIAIAGEVRDGYTLRIEQGRWLLLGPPSLTGERDEHELPVSARSMHGGIHLALPGDYWRTWHRPELYEQLITATKTLAATALRGWEPTHCTASRIDLATEEGFSSHTARTVRQYGFGEALGLDTQGGKGLSWGDNDPVDGELRQEATRIRERLARTATHRQTSTQHVYSPAGATWYVGFAGKDPNPMRDKDVFIRVYSKAAPIAVRTIRREVEFKDIPGDTLKQQIDHCIAKAAYLLDVPPVDALHLAVPIQELSGDTRLSIQDYCRRIIGMTLTAQRRALQTDPEHITATLHELVAHLLGDDAELAFSLIDAAKKKRKPKN